MAAGPCASTCPDHLAAVLKTVLRLVRANRSQVREQAHASDEGRQDNHEGGHVRRREGFAEGGDRHHAAREPPQHHPHGGRLREQEGECCSASKPRESGWLHPRMYGGASHTSVMSFAALSSFESV